MENKKISQQINNVVADNIEKLKTIFPNVVKDGIVDFKALELELREITEEETEQKERYDFTWAGKTKAKKKAQEDIYCKTLNYIEGDGKDEDTTQNLYIEGDNLEVLKLLRQNYYGAIKMIYIDPPYNTGNDFIYNDNFKEDSIESDIKEGIRNEEGARLEQNTKSDNRYHANWLTMMYPRLKIARDLLSEDGVIFISIDDNELDNLKKICNEIFGEQNFRNTIITRRRIKSLNSQFSDRGLNSLNIGFEYILVYSKTEKFLMKALYSKKSNIPKKGRWDVFWNGADRPTMRYDILGFTPETGQWRYSEEKAKIAINNYKIFLEKFSDKMSLEEYWKQEGGKLQFIRRIENGTGKNGGVQHWIPPTDLTLRTTNWTDIEVSQINKEIDVYFSNPKNKELIMELIKLNLDNSGIILDFFSGSATTAHAVMQLNGEDGGNRKYIMVQIPEECDEKTEAYKNGYKNICEIGKERIRRAGEKIKGEIEKYNTQLKLDEEPKKIPDIGFKLFRVANTNIKWNNIQNEGQLDINTLKGTPDQIDFILNAKDKDIVYEIMLRQKNIPLTSKIILLDNIGNRTYLYANLYLICLETDITDELIEKLSQINPLPRKFIFRDSAFSEDCNRKEKTFRLLDNLIKKNYGEDTYNIEFI